MSESGGDSSDVVFEDNGDYIETNLITEDDLKLVFTIPYITGNTKFSALSHLGQDITFIAHKSDLR